MELHFHFLNEKVTILKNVERYCLNGNFIEIFDEQDCVMAVVNATQMLWMEIFD